MKSGELLTWRRFTTIAALRNLVDPEKFDLEQVRAHVRGIDAGLSIGGAIFFGFFGGLILNVMPCVLAGDRLEDPLVCRAGRA